MTTKKLTAMILLMAMIVSLFSVSTFSTMAADAVAYIGADGQETSVTDYTLLSSADEVVALSSGWYVAQGSVDYSSTLTVSGDVHLVLCEEAVLCANAGISLESSSKLTVYTQSGVKGRIIAKGSNSHAGIECTDSTLVVNGGEIDAVGGHYAAGIGGNRNFGGGNVTINGGYVNATGGLYGAGIGGGDHGGGGSLTVNGGSIYATAGGNAAGIGGGNVGDGGTFIINDGAVFAFADIFDRHIGGGVLAAGTGTKNINGGIVFEGNSGAMHSSNVNISDFFELSADKSLTIGNGYTLNIKEGALFVNYGNVINNGTIENHGGMLCVEETSSFTNNATFNCYRTATAHPFQWDVSYDCVDCGLPDEAYYRDGVYHIGNLSQLVWYSQNGRNEDFSSPFKIKLISDITIKDHDSDGFVWSPIKNMVYGGTAEFDGNGKTITLDIERTDSSSKNVGLFEEVRYVDVKDLTLKGSISVSTTGVVGPLAGGFYYGNITNVVSYVNVTDIQSGHGAGGLVGSGAGSSADWLEIKNCAVYGNVKAPQNVGGFLAHTGSSENKYISIDSSVYKGVLRATSGETSQSTSYAVGAIAASADGAGNTLKLSDVYYNAVDLNGNSCPPIDVYSWQSKKTTVDMSQFDTENVAEKSLAEFASGDVTYCLNRGVTDGTQSWYQTCGEGLPLLSGLTVYKGFTSCASGETTAKYSNDVLYPEKPGHDYDNACDASCGVCGEERSIPGHDYRNGLCTRCNDGIYVVSTPDDLMWFASHVNAGNFNANAKLTTNLDMSGYSWTPIARTDVGEDITDGYSATFDGGGYVISNVSVAVPQSSKTLGIFGTVASGGTVKNLGVSNIRFNNTATYYSLGGIAGQLMTNGLIKNCYVTDSILKSPYSAGGIAGLHHGTIESCYTYGIDLGGQLNRFGGICGDWPTGKVVDCYTDFPTIGSTAAGKEGELDNYSECEVMPDRFESGEITFWLNSKNPDGIWRQDIGVRKLPVLKGNRVALVNGTYKNIYSGFAFAGFTSDKTSLKVVVGEIGTYTLFVADYEDGELVDFSKITFTVSENQIGEITLPLNLGFELSSNDKVMLWNNDTIATPLCKTLVIE